MSGAHDLSGTAAARRRRIFLACLFGAPLVTLGADLSMLGTDANHFLPMTLAKVGLLLYFGIAAGLMQLLRPVADRLGLLAGCVTAAGLASGLTITTARTYEYSLRTASDPALQRLFTEYLDGSDLYLRTVMLPIPGIAFPVGLVLFAVALRKVEGLSRAVPLLLVVAAILFPLGRIPKWLPGIFACDLLLATAFVLVGLFVLDRKAETPTSEAMNLHPA